MISNRVEEGETANAYAEASELVKRWPESAHAHFSLAYVLRYAGLLEASAHECDSASALDPGDFEFRSCAYVFMLLGNPQRAMDFVSLDPTSGWAAATKAEILARQGKLVDARQSLEQTHSGVLLGEELMRTCFDPSRGSKLKEVAKKTEDAVEAQSDAEPRYMGGTLLAYCGQTNGALRLLSAATARNYCAYTALQTDPLLANIRQRPDFPKLLGDVVNCVRGDWLRGGAGIVIAGALLLFLLQPRIRATFA